MPTGEFFMVIKVFEMRMFPWPGRELTTTVFLSEDNV